jgi:uncharacterized protein YkwD
VVELTNQERAKAGLGPLAISQQLTSAAQGYAEVLATSGCFAHTCGPVPDMVGRSERAGYHAWTTLGENIAAGQRSPEEVVKQWMDSPGHRTNILNPAFTEIGVGVANGKGPYGTYWAQEFGARGGAFAASAATAGAAVSSRARRASGRVVGTRRAFGGDAPRLGGTPRRSAAQ